MTTFKIVGQCACPNYVHAVYVAQFLKKNLPCFDFTSNEYEESEWVYLVTKLHKKYKWHVNRSPIIWKEITATGEKKYLLGGLTDFWEYCYDYYGLESTLSKMDLRKIMKDFVTFREDSEITHETVRFVSIVGTKELLPNKTILKLLKMPVLAKQNGTYIKIYEENEDDRTKFIYNLNYQLTKVEARWVEVVDSLEQAVDMCDLLIYRSDLPSLPDEEYSHFRKRLKTRMALLADNINAFARRTLRVIFNTCSYQCFLAKWLIEFNSRIQSRNIVVVTADKGVHAISVVSERTGLPTGIMTAPPVWGFIPYNQFIDVRSIVFKADVYRPYARSINANKGSTLPLGTIRSELRFVAYLLPTGEGLQAVEQEIEHRDNITTRGEAKTNALLTLIKMWYSEDRNHIISLGVLSDGSFNIPNDMVFSQPVILDKKNKWKPYSAYPVNENVKERIAKMLTNIEQMHASFVDVSSS